MRNLGFQGWQKDNLVPRGWTCTQNGMRTSATQDGFSRVVWRCRSSHHQPKVRICCTMVWRRADLSLPEAVRQLRLRLVLTHEHIYLRFRVALNISIKNTLRDVSCAAPLHSCFFEGCSLAEGREGQSENIGQRDTIARQRHR